jgi:tetratricopeptide (TPR) repeat protein
MLANLRVSRDRQVAALTRAYQLRDRLTERERRLTEASYYSLVRGREDSAVVSLERLLDVWPEDGWALNNMGVYRQRLGDHTGAMAFYRRATIVEPYNGLSWTNVVGATLAAGQYDSAVAYAAEFRKVLPGHADVPALDFALALARWDFDSGEQLVRTLLKQAGADPALRRRWLHSLAGVYQITGRLSEANRSLTELETAWQQAGNMDRAVEAFNRRVYLNGRYSSVPGRAAQILADGERRLELTDTPAPGVQYWLLTMAASRAGAVEQANRFLNLARQQLAAAPDRVGRMQLSWAQAELAVASGRDLEAAIDSVRVYSAAPCLECSHANLAMLFDRANQRDSALVHYREYAETRQAGWLFGLYRIDLPHAYHRLGELYEWKGDRARAVEYYQKFVDLWQQADRELQPRVQNARRRIAELSGEPRPT